MDTNTPITEAEKEDLLDEALDRKGGRLCCGSISGVTREPSTD